MRTRETRQRPIPPEETPVAVNGRAETGVAPARHVGGLPAAAPEKKALRWIAALLAIALMLALRLVALGSDPYARLSWSAAQLTDEGFYIHNARNLILFGHARTDGFNNALIMPTLHYVQVAVFSLFGVGAVQARMI
ncbi:MAG TPA: hypothetical protein VKT32_12150, partial [Chthonomonadaceae bacterium]|nr:hypothetical protein [Chthonomonadaceae bacterium]